MKIFKTTEEPITYLYKITQCFFFKTDLLINVFIGELFFCFSYIIIAIPCDNTEALICFFNEYISVISARDLIAFHSS